MIDYNEISNILRNDSSITDKSRELIYEIFFVSEKLKTNTLWYGDDYQTDKKIAPNSEVYDILISFLEKKYQEEINNEANRWNTYTLKIQPNGQCDSIYWYDLDTDKHYKLQSAKDFPHAAATNLVNYHFFDTKFKRKFTRIHWTMEVKNGEAFFEVYSINEKNKQLPIDVSVKGTQLYQGDSKSLYFEGFWKYKLLEHYEATHNGILKDVWKPWNKIVINIPPNGYLNENEDIAYYLDDVELEKDFFLRGY